MVSGPSTRSVGTGARRRSATVTSTTSPASTGRSAVAFATGWRALPGTGRREGVVMTPASPGPAVIDKACNQFGVAGASPPTAMTRGDRGRAATPIPSPSAPALDSASKACPVSRSGREAPDENVRVGKNSHACSMAAIRSRRFATSAHRTGRGLRRRRAPATRRPKTRAQGGPRHPA